MIKTGVITVGLIKTGIVTEGVFGKKVVATPTVAPTVLTHPTSLTITAGNTATLTSTGKDYVYGIWEYFDGADWVETSHTGDTLVTGALEISANGQKWRRQYSNPIGAVVSNEAVITVTAI